MGQSFLTFIQIIPQTRLSESHLVFITEQGGAGFHWPDTAITRGQGGTFLKMAAPPRSGADLQSFP